MTKSPVHTHSCSCTHTCKNGQQRTTRAAQILQKQSYACVHIPGQKAPGWLHLRIASPTQSTEFLWGLLDPQNLYWTPLHCLVQAPHSVHWGAVVALRACTVVVEPALQ